MENYKHLLEVKNLHTSFYVPAGEVRSVSGITFNVDKGKILGIVGESGSGKSVTAASLMQILTESGHVLPGSSIVFEGEELVGMSEKELRTIRGGKIAMIFQDPMTALNPVYKIGHQMQEAMLLHKQSRIDVLCQQEQKALRDDQTSLKRLETSQKALFAEKKKASISQEALGENEKQIKANEAKIAELTKGVSVDEAALEAAKVKAQGTFELEKAKAKADYTYQRDKLLAQLVNVYRGGISESVAERSRFLNEKQAALRDPQKRELEKKALDGLAKKKSYNDELAEKLSPLLLKQREKLSKEEKKQIKKDISSLKKKYEGVFSECDDKAEDFSRQAKKRYQECVALLKKAHKERANALTRKRKESIAKVKKDLQEAYDLYRSNFEVTKLSARKRCIEMLSLVGITNPEKRMEQYPFEFSGGMLQRVMIAMALLSDPDLLIADEPTTALDVTIQAQIIDLIRTIQKKLGMGVIIITHDLGVVAQICDEVDVMYAGRIVERGSVNDVFYNPQHEYTKGLLASIPGEDACKGQRLHPIEGNPVDVFALPSGCSFAPRCEKCMEICLSRYPAEKEVGDNHIVSCFNSMVNQIKEGKGTIDDFTAYANKSFEIDNCNEKPAKKKKHQGKEESK